MDFMWSRFGGEHVTGAAKGATPPCILEVCTDERRHGSGRSAPPHRPTGQMTARAEATYDALRSQRNSVAGDTEFFSLYENEFGGTRPDRLAGVRPQVRFQRHTLELVADVCPSVQTLDAPVPQMGKSCWTCSGSRTPCCLS